MEQIASIIAMRAQRRQRAITRTGGKPWAVFMTYKDGKECRVRCETNGKPFAAKTLVEAWKFRDWMAQQFGEWCRYDVARI